MGGKTQSKVEPRLNGLMVQTSLYGNPLAIGWGRNRVSGNLIDYDDYKATSHGRQQGGKGGVGGPGISYTYAATVVIAIGQGAIAGVRSVFRDSDVYVTSGSNTACNQAGLDLYLGTASQAPWPYMASAHPSKSLAYSSTAYVAASGYSLDSGGELANHTFEVDFTIQDATVSTGDANPADVIADFLTNAQYGVPLWPAGLLGDLTAVRTYCRAQGLFISPLLDSQTQASQFLQEVLACANSDFVWSDGVLQVAPYGDVAVTGNGYTYTPNVTPIYDLTDNDFIPSKDGADPLTVDVSDPSDAYNIVQVEYLDRARQYNPEPVTVQDLANIAQYGARQDQAPKSLHEICDPNVANVAAQLILQRTLYIRNTYRFRLPWSFDRLDPMDVVTVTDPGLGLDRYPVRITKITEAENDCCDYEAEDLLIGVASAPLYPIQAAEGYLLSTLPPGNVSAPLLFDPPQSLLNGDLELWCAVAGTSPSWGGCVVYVSLDGTNYAEAATISGGARYGVTTADYPIAADPDTVDTLSVDLSASNGVLGAAADAEADAGATLCWLGGELIAYSAATLTATSQYNLTGYIRRGQNQTSIVDHPTGTGFARLDSSIFKYPYLAQQVGKTIYLKFASFDIFGQQLQDLSGLSAYTIALQPAETVPPAATGLALLSAWNTTQFTVVWSPAATATSYTVQVYKSDGVTLLRGVTTYAPTFSYSQADAQTDGDVERAYVIKVIADNAAGSSAPASLSVTNPAPAAVTGVSIGGPGGSRNMLWTANTESDFAGYIAVYSTTSGFNPGTSGDVFYQGVNADATLSGLNSGTTYYVRIAAFDTWSSDPTQLNFSAQASFTT